MLKLSENPSVWVERSRGFTHSSRHTYVHRYFLATLALGQAPQPSLLIYQPRGFIQASI
jgi:hypothetical protein